MIEQSKGSAQYYDIIHHPRHYLIMEFNMQAYFGQLDHIRRKGSKSSSPLAFRHHNPGELALGKRMEGRLRFAACCWHIFCWNGTDMFGMGALNRPQQQPGETLALARRKTNVAFEFFRKLRVPFYCFHDVDVSPEDASLKEYIDNFAQMVNVLASKQEEGGMKLLWGTANYFTNPRYDADAATNPDPEVFNWAATQVITAMETAHKLGGENYVLQGDREGYETLLNTDLRQGHERLGRFMQIMVEHKHKIDFQGTLLIEPKPQEPTKHQYDYDTAMVYGFLKQFDLEKEIRPNIEVNHATLTGHSFHHEVATAIALDLFGPVDAGRGDVQLGWDTDQLPNNVEENALVVCEILKAGGFATGGLSFDAKVHRQSTDKYDLFYGHIGAMDMMTLALKVAARMIENGELDRRIAQRYSDWNSELGQQTLKGQMSLADLAKYVQEHNLPPVRQSGHQEQLENLVSHYLFDK